jgi:hypothetical protein
MNDWSGPYEARSDTDSTGDELRQQIHAILTGSEYRDPIGAITKLINTACIEELEQFNLDDEPEQVVNAIAGRLAHMREGE